MERVKFAVIGCGNRGREVMTRFLKAGGARAEIAVVYDPDKEAVQRAGVHWKTTAFRSAVSLEDAVSDPAVNVVAIFSPNCFHCEAILCALKHKKRVFSEKPLATTLEDCEKIVAAEKESGLSIMTGFVLRYSSNYRKVKELLASGTFGKIINIAASENRPSYMGGQSMSADYGWRRFRKMAGPYLLEKCSHDLDLLNWYAESLPEKVSAFCGLDYFTPANASILDRVGHETFDNYVPEQHRINPFTSEKDIFDNHSVILQYPNGIKMSFQLTLANAIPERRMYISCTEGTIVLECFSGSVKYKRYTDPFMTELTFPGGGHGNGDAIMTQEIMDSWLNDTPLAVSGTSNGLDCARVALAADQSALTGKTILL